MPDDALDHLFTYRDARGGPKGLKSADGFHGSHDVQVMGAGYSRECGVCGCWAGTLKATAKCPGPRP